MDVLAMAKAAVTYVLPFLKESKAVEDIGKEVKAAANTSLEELWEWVKPIFIEEFETEEGLDDAATNEAIVEHEVKKALNKKSEDELAKFEALLEQLKADKERGALTITGDKNVIIKDADNNEININIS